MTLHNREKSGWQSPGDIIVINCDKSAKICFHLFLDTYSKQEFTLTGSSQNFRDLWNNFSINTDTVAAGERFPCKMTHWRLATLLLCRNIKRKQPNVKQLVESSRVRTCKSAHRLWLNATCQKSSRIFKFDGNYLLTFANPFDSHCSQLESDCEIGLRS